MKREILYLFYAHCALAVFLTYLLFNLITLLFDFGYERKDGLVDSELNPINSDLQQPQLIPKIIHQTYKTTDIPENWKAGQQSCIDLHPDYQYILWTDEMARDFIAEEFPWFLDTFDSYKYPIQRADSIRYFVLSHFGGVYIDLDDGCQRRLDPLLTVPAFVRTTAPSGISNDVMGSVPRHPFFLRAIDSLKEYNRNWLDPYITIMYSTGPLFLSAVWQSYKRWGVPAAAVVRIMLPQDYKGNEKSFFKISKGNSWHADDAQVLLFAAKHLPTTVVCGFLIAFTLMFLEYLLVCALCSINYKRVTKGIWNIIRFRPWSQGNNYARLNPHKQAKYLKTRNRKDSNLPAALNIDLEKNVSSVVEDVY